jgi:hypothetical protein
LRPLDAAAFFWSVRLSTALACVQPAGRPCRTQEAGCAQVAEGEAVENRWSTAGLWSFPPAVDNPPATHHKGVDGPPGTRVYPPLPGLAFGLTRPYGPCRF